MKKTQKALAARADSTQSLTDEEAREAAALWMLERWHLRWLFERFPPTCTVRGAVPLVCPAPGEVGWIVSYTDGGEVSVVCDLNPIRGYCRPESLELVDCHRGMTPEWVREVFDGSAPGEPPAGPKEKEG